MSSIPCNYEINVAKKVKHPTFYSGKYSHYCKIELGDCLSETAYQKYRELREMFGEEYKLDLTYWDCKGQCISEEEIYNDKSR